MNNHIPHLGVLKSQGDSRSFPCHPDVETAELATANIAHDSAEALRRPIAGMWLTMGRPFSFVSAIVAPGPPSDNTGVLRRVK